jgi:hypothetical protein
MAHNTRVRADATAWIAGPVLNTEFDALDAGQYKSINGDDGGTWAPAIPITIGGSGLTLIGPTSIADLRNSHVQSGWHFYVDSGGNIAVNGTITINASGDLSIASSGTATVESGGDLKVESGGTITIESGGTQNIQSGGTVAFAGGSSVTLNGYSQMSFTAASGLYYMNCVDWAGLVGNWASTKTYFTQDTSPTKNDVFTLPVPLSPGATITALRVYLKGSGGHTGTPQYPPTLALYKISRTDGSSETLVAEVVDTEVVGGDYESVHYIEVPGLSEFMGGVYIYQIRVYGEGGTNSQSGLQVFSVWVYYSATNFALL